MTQLLCLGCKFDLNSRDFHHTSTTDDSNVPQIFVRWRHTRPLLQILFRLSSLVSPPFYPSSPALHVAYMRWPLVALPLSQCPNHACCTNGPSFLLWLFTISARLSTDKAKIASMNHMVFQQYISNFKT